MSSCDTYYVVSELGTFKHNDMQHLTVGVGEHILLIMLLVKRAMPNSVAYTQGPFGSRSRFWTVLLRKFQNSVKAPTFSPKPEWPQLTGILAIIGCEVELLALVVISVLYLGYEGPAMAPNGHNWIYII